MHESALPAGITALLEAFDEPVCLLDGSGGLLYMNRPAKRLLGHRERQLQGRNLLEELTAGSLRGVSLLGKDGCTVLQPFATRPVRIDDAELRLLRFATPGSTACESALQDIESVLHAVLDTLVDGIVVIDERGIVRLFTPSAERMFGYDRDEVLGRNVAMLMPSPYREEHDSYLRRYLETGVARIIGQGREVQARRKDGRIFPVYLAVGELHTNEGRWFVGILRDLTAHKEAQERLVMLSSAVDQSPSAVLIADLHGRIQYVNRGFVRLTGYLAEELVGTRPSLGVGPDQERWRRLHETIRSRGERYGEVADCRKNGETYWALESITPVRDAAGAITHYLVIQQNITGQKRDKEALAESEERFRQVAEMAGEWLWEQDPEGRYLYSSGAVRNILGFEPEEVLGKHYLDLLTPGDREHWMTTLSAAGTVEKPFFRLINRYRHKDGHEVYTESTGAPIFDEYGRLVKWRGVDHDITARKTYEDQLRVRNRAIESASVGINIADARAPGLPNIYVNPALSRITGYSREELMHHSMRMLQGPDTDPDAIEKIRGAIRAGQPCEVTLKNYRKDGTPFWNELLISPVRDEEGVVTHYIGIQTDVTERRRAEEERHQLEIAKQIQLSLLPKEPLRLPTAEIAGLCVPATHVGGDYFDYFSCADLVDIVIADVSGHSVGAALIMTEARSALRTEARRTLNVTGESGGVGEILSDLNEMLYEDLSGADLFITMFYLRYHGPTRTLSYANAGHGFALLLRKGEESCIPLDADGLILGVRKGIAFEEKSLKLNPGDWVLLYTDGVVEVQNGEGEFFGISRLCQRFSNHRALTPEQLVQEILAELHAFGGKVPFQDDVSMVAFKIC